MKAPGFRLALKCLVSILTLVVIAITVDLPAVLALFQGIHPGFLLAVLLLVFGQQFLHAWKMALALSNTGARFGDLVRIGFLISFLRNLLPSLLAGDAARVMYLKQSAGGVEPALAAVGADRLTNLLVQMCIVAVASILYGVAVSNRSWAGLGVVMALLCVAFVAMVVLSVKKVSRYRFGTGRIGAWLSRHGFSIETFAKSVQVLVTRPRRMWQLMGVSAVYQCLIIANVVVLSRGFGSPVGFHTAALVSFAAMLVTIIPISIAGWGVVEAVYTSLYALTAAHEEAGLAVSLALRLLLLGPGFIGQVLFMRRAPNAKTGSKSP